MYCPPPAAIGLALNNWQPAASHLTRAYRKSRALSRSGMTGENPAPPALFRIHRPVPNRPNRRGLSAYTPSNYYFPVPFNVSTSGLRFSIPSFPSSLPDCVAPTTVLRRFRGRWPWRTCSSATRTTSPSCGPAPAPRPRRIPTGPVAHQHRRRTGPGGPDASRLALDPTPPPDQRTGSLDTSQWYVENQSSK